MGSVVAKTGKIPAGMLAIPNRPHNEPERRAGS